MRLLANITLPNTREPNRTNAQKGVSKIGIFSVLMRLPREHERPE